jgi:hypothetical protein
LFLKNDLFRIAANPWFIKPLGGPQMAKGRSKSRGGRPSLPRDEQLTETICFRTTAAMKAKAEHLAKAEGRSVSSLLQRLIHDRYRGEFDRAAPYRAAGGGKISEFDVA